MCHIGDADYDVNGTVAKIVTSDKFIDLKIIVFIWTYIQDAPLTDGNKIISTKQSVTANRVNM